MAKGLRSAGAIQFFVSDGGSPTSWAQLGEVVDLQEGARLGVAEASNLDSVAAEYIAALAENGLTLTIMYRPDIAVQQTLKNALRAGTRLEFKILFVASTITTVFFGFVTDFDTLAKVGKMLVGDLTIKMDTRETETIPEVHVFGTFDPLATSAGIVLSNGNLTLTHPGSGPFRNSRGTIASSTLKRQYELTIVAGSAAYIFAGIGTIDASIVDTDFVGEDVYGYGYMSQTAGAQRQKWHSGIPATYGTVFANGDVIGVVIDFADGGLEFFNNGVSQGVAYTGISGAFFPIVTGQAGNIVVTGNFGDSAFVHPVSGAVGWYS